MGAYFDNAATTFPKPECVYRSMDAFYRAHGGNAGRGQYKLAAEASKIVSETRSSLCELLQCGGKEVIFTPSATIALNMVLQGILAAPGAHVYLSPFEHNAVTRTLHALQAKWDLQLHLLPYRKEVGYDLSAIKADFAAVPPDVLVLSHASNVCGLVAPVEEIAALAKQYSCTTVIDMAQTAGLVPLFVGSDLIDYAVFAGHKTLYGPIGIGGFFKKPEDMPVPILFGGTGVDSATQDMPSSSPARYETGSPNSIAIAGLHAAVRWFGEHVHEIRAAEQENHKKLLCILERHPNITVLGPSSRENCIGVVSCVFQGYSSDNIGDVLDRQEIAVRTGLHCAPVAHKTLGTFPAGTVRFSPSYYTTDEDFLALEQALAYIEENS